MKEKHDGDCDIYALRANGGPFWGICTCGYGFQYRRANDDSWKHMISKERYKLIPRGTIEEQKEMFMTMFPEITSEQLEDLVSNKPEEDLAI